MITSRYEKSMSLAGITLAAFLLLPTLASAATCVDISRPLSLNSSGSDVSKLQQFLHDNAGYAGAISGHMGSQTVAALQRWQAYKGIVSSGTSSTTGYGATGPRTRAAMSCSTNSIVSSSTQTTAQKIAALKAQLVRLQALLASLLAQKPVITTLPPPAIPPPTSISLFPTVFAPASCTTSWGATVANGSSIPAYQSSSVPSGQTCPLPETRACANGSLSGTYQYATCVVSTQPPPPLTPTVSFTQTLATTTADGTTGQSFTVAWSSTGATACTVQKSFPDGTIANPWGSGVSGSQVASPFKLGVHKWWIDCTGGGGTTHKEFIHDVVAPRPVKITENFDSREGFSLKVSGDPALIDYAVENGMLKLTHRPHDLYNFGGVEKSYEIDLSKTVWIDFRFRMQEQLLGQDMYTTVKFAGRDDLHIGIKIDSEQHWKQVYVDGSGQPACTAKDTDDEFGLSIGSAFSPELPEVRLRYPTGYTKPYTEWTTYSVKYEPPTGNVPGKFTYYVDGREAPLGIIDAPGKSVEQTTRALAGMGVTPITVSYGSLIDGGEPGYTGNSYGTRGRGCFASETPARPMPVVYPAKFANNDGGSFKADWMKKFDAIAALMMEAAKGPGLPYRSYVPPRSARHVLDALNQFIDGVPTGTFGFYDTYTRRLAPGAPEAVSASARTDLENRIWNGIYAGTIDFDAAVLMGAIPLPNADHTVWGFAAPEARQKLQDTLSRLAQFYGNLAPPERYVWDMLHEKGGAVDAVHFGYVTPVAIRASDIWQALSPQEKADIQVPSTPVPAVFYWDYFRISYSPPQLVSSSRSNTNLASTLAALESALGALRGIFNH